MNKSNKFSPEVRERAVGWCKSTVGRTHRCGQQSSRSHQRLAACRRPCSNGSSALKSMAVYVQASPAAQRVKDLEREVKELRRANEILKLASAFFAQAELDRRLKS